MLRWTASLLVIVVLCFGNAQEIFGEPVAGQGTEQIYYCAEIGSSGFFLNQKTGSYEKTTFIVEKFKIKFNSSDKSILVKRENNNSELFICKFHFAHISDFATCKSRTKNFNFNTTNGRFVRSTGFGYVAGDHDDFSISYGKCDTF